MSQVSNNADINKLINFFDGEYSMKNGLGMNKLKTFIENDPTSNDLSIFRDYLYKKLLESEKDILLLEKILSREDFKKQERRLNIYRTLYNSNLNQAVTYWSSLVGLTEPFSTFYEFIKSASIYADLNNRNEFFKNINQFITEENFNFDEFNKLIIRNDKYPSKQQIKNNYIVIKNKAKNFTKELGIYGELCSYEFLKQELNRIDREDLADRTIWVARDIGDHFGFDQTSFDENEEELILEVKATDSKKFESEKDNFYMTQNEFQKMKELKDEYNYLVVRVYIDEKGFAHLYYLKPNDDMSVEYGDVKYVTDGKLAKNKTTYEYKREPKKKVFKLD